MYNISLCLQRVDNEWREVLIDIDETSSAENQRLRFVISRNETPVIKCELMVLSVLRYCIAYLFQYYFHTVVFSFY